MPIWLKFFIITGLAIGGGINLYSVLSVVRDGERWMAAACLVSACAAFAGIAIACAAVPAGR